MQEGGRCSRQGTDERAMTYCVGLLLKAGMVLLSDTRTNAGLDNIATYRKMFVFEDPGERVVAIMTAGSLSVTQTAIARLREAVDDPDSDENSSIMRAHTMLKVAEIVGATLAAVRDDIEGKMNAAKVSVTASMIVAGQRRGGAMRMFLIYPEGNFIEATEDTPFLQIGEHKYGKPILDRVVRPATGLEDARKAVLLSMDSTLKSNLSVGMPLDLLVIPADACRVGESRRFESDDPVFRAMSAAWSTALRKAFQDIEI
jgi:putative proteasome-type protease